MSQQANNNFVLGLEDNAYSSLEHGVEHFLAGSDSDLKFTILHIFHAVELLLKARLANEHPLLVLQKPEDDLNKGRTVDYYTMLRRLKNVGISLTAEDTKTLEYLHTVRNRIEHYEIAGDRSDIEEYVGRAMKFLDRFVERQLDTRLKDRLSSEVYKELERALYSYEERLARLQARMDKAIPGKLEDRLNYDHIICDECGEEAVLVPDPTTSDSTVHCFECDAKFYYWTCDRCGTPTLTSSPPSSEDRDTDICDVCWDDILSRD